MSLESYPGTLRDCDRCGKTYKVEELREQVDTEGLYVCSKCYDERGFDEAKADNLIRR